jgi:hypothetical protein
MNKTRLHVVAAILLTLGGLLTAVAASALIVAGAAVAAGMAVDPSDAAVLADLESMLPLVLAFVVLDLAAARGLVTGRTWAPVAATLLAMGVVTMGLLGLLLLLLGNDPLIGAGATRNAMADGLGIVAAFTGIYLSVLIALRLVGPPSGKTLAAGA